jgi:iron complex outermembrane receptor protein
MNSTSTRKFAILMGSASLFTVASALSAQAQMTAQAQMAQAGAAEAPEEVLITGSLIRGAAAVGVPVTNLGVQDFATTGNPTIGDLFRTVPVANVAPGPAAVNSGGHQERETRVNIRGLDQTGPRTLLMIDGVRFPPQADGICAIDPSIIPALALDRVDILADGASATYGSDAIAGVINVILKRNYDGAMTLLHVQAPEHGGLQYQASQIYGRTWDGGDITLTYEWLDEQPIYGTAHSNYTSNYTPWGLDNQIPLGSTRPGIITNGKPADATGKTLAATTAGITCANCYSIPAGTGVNFPGGLGPQLPSSAATLNWSQFSTAANGGTNGVRNMFDPLKLGWEEGAQQKNSFVATFDQRLTKDISFFATGFYANRRVQEILPAWYSGGTTGSFLKTLAVPTVNPYYPTGGAPSGLRVSYSFATEIPPSIPAYELSYRYQFGFNVALPYDWKAEIYDSRSYEAAVYLANLTNGRAINAALGDSRTDTKPANIPYLNLFCDPTQHQCNSPLTLNYIGAQRYLGVHYIIEEKAAHFDGPVFDLPGGTLKAAIGGSYESDNVLGFADNTSGRAPQSVLAPLYDSSPFTVWAGFVQTDIPIFGDNFNLPGFRKFDLELSWRHDQYSSSGPFGSPGPLVGGTSNPRFAFTWLLDQDLGATIRGSWGTSFRFANAGEYSTVLSDANGSLNIAGGDALILSSCTPGSAAAALYATGLFGACSNVVAGTGAPGGISWSGGPHPELRAYIDPNTHLPTTREGGVSLGPETSINYSLGAEFAPQTFLKGLDVQATWYSVKVNGTLLGFNQTTVQTTSDPAQRFHYILPSDLGCAGPGTPSQAAINAANANPAACAPFQQMVLAAISDRNSTTNIGEQTKVYWISDGSTVGTGFLKVQGVDWNASYDWDTGDFGAWNAGITGTYYLHRLFQTVPGTPVVDAFHQTIQNAGGIAQAGVETLPRFIYRARLGWSNGPWNVTGFLNYFSHFYTQWPVPPNVNNQCTAPQGTVGGGTNPCAINGWSNIEPSWYTFDLSLGYDTGDTPANDYLKGITIQFTVQNLLGKHSPFEYGPSTSTRNVAAYDITKPNGGRTIGLTLLKHW